MFFLDAVQYRERFVILSLLQEFSGLFEFWAKRLRRFGWLFRRWSGRTFDRCGRLAWLR
jgi:hypothetical protein